nr:hypothetical protein [Novosphingobium sp. CCH12-A3]
MRFIDFSSWQSTLLTLIGLRSSVISMGIRMIMMFTIQQRREIAARFPGSTRLHSLAERLRFLLITSR